MKFTAQEIEDLLCAIQEAQDELCIDLSDSGNFPEATGYYNRLNALAARLRNEAAT